MYTYKFMHIYMPGCVSMYLYICAYRFVFYVCTFVYVCEFSYDFEYICISINVFILIFLMTCESRALYSN